MAYGSKYTYSVQRSVSSCYVRIPVEKTIPVGTELSPSDARTANNALVDGMESLHYLAKPWYGGLYGGCSVAFGATGARNSSLDMMDKGTTI
jgi:hypothetical protein